MDSKDAFRRGAFCLKQNKPDAALYWLNQALEDQDLEGLEENKNEKVGERARVQLPSIEPNIQVLMLIFICLGLSLKREKKTTKKTARKRMVVRLIEYVLYWDHFLM